VGQGTYEVDPTTVRDIAPEVLGDDGRLKILPAAYWADTTPAERMLFGFRHGIYSFPTVELVERLREIIGGRVAIEIGAGHGVLADALGIPGTDNREQEKPGVRMLLAMQGSPPVRYGPNIVEAHASRAVRLFKAEVVIGCWVTQLWDPRASWNPGDSKLDGVDEEDIIRQCQFYVLVGNEKVHEAKRIWSRPHHIEYPPFVYSRAMNGAREFIAVWKGSGMRKQR